MVVKVNERVITSYEVAKRYRSVIKASGLKAVSKREQALLLDQVIYKMINEELIEQEAAKLQISVADDELNDIIAGSSSSIDASQLKSNLLWSKIVSEVIAPKVKVKDNEVNELIEQEKLNSKINKFLTAELFLAEGRNAAEIKSAKETKELADKLVKELRSGANFKKLVEQFSSGTEAESALGWVSKDEIDPKVYQVIANLAVGAYSNPIRLNDGYHIFKLLNKKTEIEVKPQDFNRARNMLMKRKVQTAARGYLLDMHRNSFVEINLKNLAITN